MKKGNLILGIILAIIFLGFVIAFFVPEIYNKTQVDYRCSYENVSLSGDYSSNSIYGEKYIVYYGVLNIKYRFWGQEFTLCDEGQKISTQDYIGNTQYVYNFLNKTFYQTKDLNSLKVIMSIIIFLSIVYLIKDGLSNSNKN